MAIDSPLPRPSDLARRRRRQRRVHFLEPLGHGVRRHARLFESAQDSDQLLDVRIDWSVIDPARIMAVTSGKRMGLQIADAVASSCFYAVQPSRHGFTEDRYVRMLKPLVYHREGKHVGYGLKFWPREVDALLASQESLRWVRDHYK